MPSKLMTSCQRLGGDLPLAHNAVVPVAGADTAIPRPAEPSAAVGYIIASDGRKAMK